MSGERMARIRERLARGFPGAAIDLEDESHLHAGHAGAQSGRGHYRVRIASETFTGMSPIARHRAVYAALGELMETDIHAVSIDARTP
jgi:BolA family transcriptional regulator, general stress-responsive regulator